MASLFAVIFLCSMYFLIRSKASLAPAIPLGGLPRLLDLLIPIYCIVLYNRPNTYSEARLVVKEIRFYRSSDSPFGCFSNLYRRPMDFEGETYPTAEHAYQAGKPRKKGVREWLMAAPSPSLLAMAAHGLYYWDITPGWSTLKFARMKAVLSSKFLQHEDLQAILLGTRDARLVESTTVDNAVNRLWGEVNGFGRNMLGILLMDVRSEIRDAAAKRTLRRSRRAKQIYAAA